jgi:hypothetical protein
LDCQRRFRTFVPLGALCNRTERELGHLTPGTSKSQP